MSERDFYRDDAKHRVTAVIKEVEKLTSAELLVSVRHQSANLRQTDYLFGFAFSVVMLLLLLYLPLDFALWSFPIDVVLTFALGTLACAQVGPLRRMLSSSRLRTDAVHDAACAAFLRLGASRTTRRTGVLVFVSTHDRLAEIVSDVGIDAAALGAPWQRAIESVRATAARADFDGFVAALRALGPVLAETLPRREGDANELPDDMDAA